MDCKSCGAELREEAVFCPMCGTPIDSVTCPRCRAAVKSEAKFCPKCGMPMDGSTVCGRCGAPIPPTTEFCPKCGVSADGRRKCLGCGEPSLAGDRFCAQCGTPLSPACVPASKGQPVAGASVVRDFVYPLVRKWLAVGLLVAILILSLFGMPRYSTSVSGFDLTLNVRGYQIVAGAFQMIDPPTGVEAVSDFEAFVKANVKTIDTSNMSEAQATKLVMKETRRLLQKYGVLRLAVTKEAVENSPSFVLSIVSWTVLILAIWVLGLVFLIFALRSAILFTIGKTEFKSRDTLAFSLLFALTLCFIPLAGVGLAGPAIAILVLSALFLIGVVICKYVLSHDKFRLKPVLNHSIGFALSVILLAVSAAGAYGIRAAAPVAADNASDTVKSSHVYTGSGTLNDITAGMDNYDSASAGTNLVLYYRQTFATIENYYGVKDITSAMTSSRLAPFLLSFFPETVDFKAGTVTFSYLVFFMKLLFAACAAFVLVACANGLTTAKATRFPLFELATLVCVTALFVFTIITVALGNSAARQVLDGVLQYKIGPSTIVMTVFALGNFIKGLILNSEKPASPDRTLCSANASPTAN